MDVNYAQIEAINHFKGPMLVLAGPGSGKTYIITRRIVALINEHKVDPSKILVVTFSKEAANQMKERFEKLVGGRNYLVNFGTFHAVFFRILRYAYHYDANNILREDEKYELLRSIIEGIETEHDNEKEFLSSIVSQISMIKSKRIDVNYYYPFDCSTEEFVYIYESYEKALRNLNKIDFDDMLILCFNLLVERPDILALWQNQYEYILIDEFQDINVIQYDIIKMLAKPQNNIFIVGDDDQSIYEFRGATPQIMLNFDSEFPGGKIIYLEKNYRSQNAIVELANKLIKNNQNRYKKHIISTRLGDEKPHISKYQKITDENESIIEKIKMYNAKGIDYSKMALLYRTNNEPRLIIERLMDNCIPFKVRDAIPNIYEHFIARSFLAYLAIANGSNLRSDFLTIVNRPKRYISRAGMPNQEVTFSSLRAFYKDKPYMLKNIYKLEKDLKAIKGLAPYGAIKYIKKAMGFDSYLNQYATENHIDYQDLLAISEEILESSRKVQTYHEFLDYIEKYKIEFEEKVKNRNNVDKNSVTISTYHAAKGLEFDVVFLPDVNEGYVPHKKATTLQELEEERRMFYVAMTRAKDYLHISYVKQKFTRKLDPSRYITELSLSNDDFEVGKTITHKKYGKGKIIKLNGSKATIKFDGMALPKVLDIQVMIKAGVIR